MTDAQSGGIVTQDGAGSAEPARRETRAEQLRVWIETEIVAGRFLPGEKLDEKSLAERLSVSRTPIREALRSLAAVGLVSIERQLGATVAQPSVLQIMELFETVSEFEAVAARLACIKGDDSAIAAIMEAHDACRVAAQSEEPSLYFEANGAFHKKIWAASGNSALQEQISAVDRRLAPYRKFITFRHGRSQDAIDEHEQIAQAIYARNANDATEAMRAHVKILGDDVLSLARNLGW